MQPATLLLQVLAARLAALPLLLAWALPVPLPLLLPLLLPSAVVPLVGAVQQRRGAPRCC